MDDITDGCAITRSATLNGNPEEVLIVRRGREVWAYRNSCPHFSVGLDAQPGVIYTYQSSVLMCAHHSALFRFEDGECIDGPCQGFQLDAVPVHIDGEQVMLADSSRQNFIECE
jgi:nitrite reductase/ring-hydroxylating ferredoxin subunit